MEPYTKTRQKSGTLELILKDMNGQLISARTRVVVTSKGPSEPRRYRADGKSGEVTQFLFAIPPGDYSVRVRANGFQEYHQGVTVRSGETSAYEILLRLGESEENKGQDDEERVQGRIDAFIAPRAFPRQELPQDARQIALEQKNHMNDPEVLNARLYVEEIEDPLPRSSFGTINVFVRVTPRDSYGMFPESVLAIPYSQEKLGWVDETTLRAFEVNLEEGRFYLIAESWVDAGQHCVFAHIERPGVYAIIGLPKHPAIRETVRLFDLLQATPEEGGGDPDLQKRICDLILCASGFELSPDAAEVSMPIVPGGARGNICDFCRGIRIPAGGLPERKLLPNGGGPDVFPLTTNCTWRTVGPRNINGRVRALAIHPTDGNTIYAGAGTGGVWVSHDAGQSWTPLTDDQPVLEIGALAVHLTDPAKLAGHVTIYAGTGEFPGYGSYNGIGILKSTDSGATWSLKALPAPGLPRFAVILVDPNSVTASPTTDIVYAGGKNSGGGALYKSSDGGATWELLLKEITSSLVMDPVDSTILYAGVSLKGIFKFDPTAKKWESINAGLATPFPQLIQVAIGQSTPHKLYAKLDQTVYAFDSVTKSWKSLGNHGGETYVYWNNVLAVDPKDSDIIFAGGFSLERSSDGGKTWPAAVIGGLHPDQHAIVFDPTNHLNVYLGNDGGVYRGVSTSSGDTGDWSKVSDGLVLTELNDVGVSPGGSDIYGGGTQDEGTIRTTGGLTWDTLLGNDGCYFVVDPADEHIIYGQTQARGPADPTIHKSVDGGQSFSYASSGYPGGHWLAPLVLDPGSLVEPDRVLFVGGREKDDGKGKGKVFRSIDSAGSWSASSPEIGGEVYAIAIAPTSSAVVYAGSGPRPGSGDGPGSGAGKVWRSSDNGATIDNWKDITVGTIAGSAKLPERSVMDIVVASDDPDTVYVTFSGFGIYTPATPGHVFRGLSKDGWKTWSWTDISSNLPDIPVNALEIDPTSSTTLYIGTDVGVFSTSDGGLFWARFETGLPNVIIRDLALSASRDTLLAATHGRGMFEIQLTGTCRDPDVYIRDNKLDTGEAIPSPSDVIDPTRLGYNVYWWESPDIKVDAFPYFPVDALFDGVEFDLAIPEDVVRNDATHPDANRLYVQVHNRGPKTAHNVKVKVLWADASAVLPALPGDFWARYPNDWTAVSDWHTVDSAVPFQNIPELLPNTPKILTWNWTVPTTAAEHTCILAVISADKDRVVRSDTNPDNHLLWLVVPNDKHVAQRNLHIVTGETSDGAPPKMSTIDFNNPFPYPQYFDIVVDGHMLPKGAAIDLLLPKVQMSSGTREELAAEHLRNRDSALTLLTGKEPWWDDVPHISRKDWHYYAHTVGPSAHGGHEERPTVASVLIPAGEKVRALLIVTMPPRAKPGSAYRFVIMQRVDTNILGGSTYEVRTPPARASMHIH